MTQLARRASCPHSIRAIMLLLVALAPPSLLHAQPAKPHERAAATRHDAPAPSASTPAEQRASRIMEAARSNSLALHAFLERMPKGADLHMHLSGAVYAETFLEDAIADRLCVNPVTLSFAPNMGVTHDDPALPVCLDPSVPAARVHTDQHLYDAMVDSLSMRGFVPTPGVTGHDQFFATFGRADGLTNHTAEWMDEVTARAERQNEQYLEIMLTPRWSAAAKSGYKVKWPAEAAGPQNVSTDQFNTLRSQMMQAGLQKDVDAGVKEIDEIFAARQKRCDASNGHPPPGCSVQVRILYQVTRANPPSRVFAQTLIGFEIAKADPRVVGINFVQPEDAFVAMAEYHRQMLMLDYLHALSPHVHISLHAGELAPGLVPPDGLRFHIREAVELGHAERIGHGVDVMFEDRPRDLLDEMAAKHVMVEINLTSNDVILGVKANEHSFPSYRVAGVPLALSTDDEGVSRIDLTHEYSRAAHDFNLSYLDLKRMARTGLEHSFLPGVSLWTSPDLFTRSNFACPRPSGAPSAAPASPACKAFLAGSEKAAQQWELERRFAVFEASLP